MSKIYVVTEGNYSDYQILAVYDDKELAEEYIKLYGGEIEEYELNPYKKEIKEGIALYQIAMLKNGDVENVSKSVPDDNYGNLGLWFFGKSFGKETMVYRLITDSEERAIKIVNEKRSMILSENLWGIEFVDEINQRLGLK